MSNFFSNSANDTSTRNLLRVRLRKKKRIDPRRKIRTSPLPRKVRLKPRRKTPTNPRPRAGASTFPHGSESKDDGQLISSTDEFASCIVSESYDDLYLCFISHRSHEDGFAVQQQKRRAARDPLKYNTGSGTLSGTQSFRCVEQSNSPRSITSIMRRTRAYSFYLRIILGKPSPLRDCNPAT